LPQNPTSRRGGPAANRVAREVDVDAGEGLELPGILTIPPQPAGVVVFAQGSGSSRLRPPDRAVARALNMAGFATLLFDLLTLPEEAEERNIFDVALMTPRLVAATKWLHGQRATSGLPLGYIGARRGAAALCAAAELGGEIGAIVLRSGRTDLVQSRLADVVAPTLLIVGGNDWELLECNRRAQSLLRCANDLAVVPGAAHFFEEPGGAESDNRRRDRLVHPSPTVLLI
jgi:putative phosphoribosyl transferase